MLTYNRYECILVRLTPKVIMNERIKELAKQAYEDVIKNTPSFLVTKELYEQKFAELIVKECLKLNSKELSITAIERLLPLYKEHFGVEE